jgi:hypothetical protein
MRLNCVPQSKKTDAVRYSADANPNDRGNVERMTLDVLDAPGSRTRIGVATRVGMTNTQVPIWRLNSEFGGQHT